jgi:hypothetical protein
MATVRVVHICSEFGSGFGTANHLDTKNSINACMYLPSQLHALSACAQELFAARLLIHYGVPHCVRHGAWGLQLVDGRPAVLMKMERCSEE